MINSILEKIKDVTMKKGTFLSDKTYKYDTVFMVSKYLDELIENDIVELSNEKMDYLVERIATDFSLPKDSYDSNKNYISETLNFLQYAKVIEKVEQNKYKIINNELLDFILVSIENTYIFLYLVVYQTFKNDELWNIYCDYCKESDFDRKEKILLNIKDKMSSMSESIKKLDTVWSFNKVKFPIMILALANNSNAVSRNLKILNDAVTPLELSANKEGTKTQQGLSKNNFYIHDFKVSYVKEMLRDYLVDSIETNEDEGTLEERIIKQYNSMNLSTMESELDGLYKEFQSKFSPSALLMIPDEQLPRYMFYSETKNQDNMCYYLEKNSKMVEYCGRAGIYSCYAFNLHFNDNHKQWVTGSGKKPVLLEYEEAIDKAKEIRQELIDACEIVSKYEGTEKIEDYSKMVVQINAKCSTLCNYQWFVKYLHMNFPKMFATFYSEEWQSFLLKKCKLPNHKTIYERSGELSLLAQRVNLPNSVLAKVLVALFGFPNDDENMIEEEENKEMVDRKPRTNKTNPLNSIIYGAPGTGKTYSTAEYAVAFVEGRKPKTNQMSETERTELMKKYRELTKNGQVVFTTFHQSYGYEDFIQGLRPDTKDGEMRFVPADGVFKKIADKAMQDQEKNYVIIIDEINRGNISKVFGELITLIEEDKRWGENNQLSVMLPSGQEFAVPNNLYIVGTMNSADKSIALIDTALRRRFEFIEVAPNEDLIKDATLKNVLVQLNAVLRKQLESSDLLIGHAYFIGKNKDDLANILNRNIIPLLYEYFYDNEKKVKDALAKAIEGTDVKINETINGRIRVE